MNDIECVYVKMPEALVLLSAVITKIEVIEVLIQGGCS